MGGGGQRCFRINFGSFKGSAIGLDNASAYNPQQYCGSGDASTYWELGKEVSNVLANIQSTYPGIGSFVLAGHSRGGLAARAAFAQNTPIMQKVRGLLTVGTPHQGSPLGRLYTWLRDARYYGATQPELDQAWKLASKVKWLSGLNMRCPTIDFLSPDSPALADLSRYQLPRGRNYAKLASSGLNLGLLQGLDGTQWLSFDVISGAGLGAWNNLPLTATNYMLTKRWNNYSPWNRAGYEGDGIVTLHSQQAMPAVVPTGNSSVVNQVYHGNETGSITAINNLLNKL